MRKISVALAFLCLAVAQSIPPDEIRSRTVAYTPPAPFALRTEVRVVEVPVVVRDGQHRAVPGLTRDDFEIRDDGTKQVITSFSVQGSSRETNGPPQPRFIALCFDNLHLTSATLKPVKDAAERFVKTSLAPDDRVAVVATGQSKDSEFTGDVQKLVDQIAKITSAQRGVSDEPHACPRILSYEAFQIANNLDPGGQLLRAKTAECSECYHSPCRESEITLMATAIWSHTRLETSSTLGVIDGLVGGMAKLPGERIILLTSAGFLAGTLEVDTDRLTDKARHAEVVINALDARGVYPKVLTNVAFDGMGVLAAGTGGDYYRDNNDLERGFRELGRAPDSRYVLGFTPPNSGPAGLFHALKVQVARGQQYSLQARPGYTALPASASPNHKASKLDSEVMASGTITELPVSFTWEQWDGPPGITMIAHLDIGHLHFQPLQDRRTLRLNIVAVVLDSQGSFVAGKNSELDLSLREDTFEKLAKTGFPAALRLSAPPGTYSVRALAQDGMENKLSAASDSVQIK
jgi:VWFA-related protein